MDPADPSTPTTTNGVLRPVITTTSDVQIHRASGPARRGRAEGPAYRNRFAAPGVGMS